QAHLPPKEAVVAYFTGKQRWYVIFISVEQVVFETLPAVEQLAVWQENARNNLKMTGEDGIRIFAQAAHQLYRSLLPAAARSKTLERLLIIPDGELAYLPFDLLLTQKPLGNNVRDFPFLFRNSSLAYAYSWAIQELNGDRAPDATRLLHVAPIFEADPGYHLPLSAAPLPATQPWQPTTLLRNAATRANFLARGQSYGLLHLASHATACDTLLREPAILCSDSLLYLRDIQNAQFTAHLVVLSACDAGIGNVQRGEGIMSLARGFAYAGVPSVVSTLWKINERTTYQLLDRFYYHLSTGKAKDEALRQAKLDFLASCSDVQLAPYYWAGLVTIGDQQSVVTRERWPQPIAFLAPLLLSLVLIIFWWYKRR
ncbi:MAG: CHAT domain-containing protein, partial [Bacteroidota bacterium]